MNYFTCTTLAMIISVSVSQATWNFSIASIRSRKSGFLNWTNRDRINSCDCGSRRVNGTTFDCVLVREEVIGAGGSDDSVNPFDRMSNPFDMLLLPAERDIGSVLLRILLREFLADSVGTSPGPFE